MKKTPQHTQTSLFLLEMLIVLLFLSLASAGCIRLFAQAQTDRMQAENSRQIRLLVTSLGESLEAWDGRLQTLSLPAGSVLKENETYQISYDPVWNLCEESEAQYTVLLKPAVSATAKELHVTIRSTQQILHEITLRYPHRLEQEASL